MRRCAARKPTPPRGRPPRRRRPPAPRRCDSIRSPSTNSSFLRLVDVRQSTSAKIVEHADAFAALDERRDNVRADETGAAGNEIFGHHSNIYGLGAKNQRARVSEPCKPARSSPLVRARFHAGGERISRDKLRVARRAQDAQLELARHRLAESVPRFGVAPRLQVGTGENEFQLQSEVPRSIPPFRRPLSPLDGSNPGGARPGVAANCVSSTAAQRALWRPASLDFESRTETRFPQAPPLLARQTIDREGCQRTASAHERSPKSPRNDRRRFLLPRIDRQKGRPRLVHSRRGYAGDAARVMSVTEVLRSEASADAEWERRT